MHAPSQIGFDHWTGLVGWIVSLATVLGLALVLRHERRQARSLVERSKELEPLRHRSPLVTGRLTRRQATAIALAQLPLMVAAHLMGGLSPRALPLLGGVVLCMTVYDVWGKASRYPLALDAALGQTDRRRADADAGGCA